ncbi:MAG: PAS domain S-box protein [Cyanobacteria bacterium P01_G01_bin.39]
MFDPPANSFWASWQLFNPLIVGSSLIILAAVYYLICREIVFRRQVAKNLQKQRERERVINHIARQIRQSLNLDEVLNTTVTEVREFLKCDRVLIYRIKEDGTGKTITEKVLSPYPSIMGRHFPEEVFPTEYHQAYIQGKSRTITDMEQDDVESCLAEFVQQFGVKAKLVVPIIQEVRNLNQSQNSTDHKSYLWGLLIAHQCSHTRQWQAIEVELMNQLATQVAIAIQQSELYTQLQQLNTNLEQRVQRRTHELARANLALTNEVIERQRTEQALRTTNHTLQSLIAASPRAIFTLDLEEQVKIWNPAAERIFGWKEAEISGQPNPVINTSEVHQYHEIRQKILQGITPNSLEIRRHRKDGSEIDIVFSAAPLIDSESHVNGIVAVVADISQQKKQAEQVRLLQSVVVNTNDAVLITEAEPIDEPGPRIIYVNEAFTRTTGYTLEEVLGKTPRILQGPKTNRQALDKVRAALAKWQPITVETINYRKDGSEFWVEFSIVAVANKQGIYTHWISVQRDITERKRLAEISLALEREREVSEIKTRFFAMASHEFRTPLSTVLAAAQLIEQSPRVWQDAEKRSRNLQRIQNSVKNMVQLLDDILTINRAETGKLEFNPQPVDLAKLCRHCVEEIQLSAGENYQITFTCSEPEFELSLDKKLMRSIMANLLSNAIKYSPQGGEVKVTLKFWRKWVEIQIADQGIGIPAKYLKRLFEPFHRAENVRRIPGTGLGLLIVKKFVDLHQGQISLTSQINVGTTVTVTLPGIVVQS